MILCGPKSAFRITLREGRIPPLYESLLSKQEDLCSMAIVRSTVNQVSARRSRRVPLHLTFLWAFSSGKLKISIFFQEILIFSKFLEIWNLVNLSLVLTSLHVITSRLVWHTLHNIFCGFSIRWSSRTLSMATRGEPSTCFPRERLVEQERLPRRTCHLVKISRFFKISTKNVNF